MELINTFSEYWKQLKLKFLQAGELLNSVSGIADICLRLSFYIFILWNT